MLVFGPHDAPRTRILHVLNTNMHGLDLQQTIKHQTPRRIITYDFFAMHYSTTTLTPNTPSQTLTARYGHWQHTCGLTGPLKIPLMGPPITHATTVRKRRHILIHNIITRTRLQTGQRELAPMACNTKAREAEIQELT
jgi:hypothetical protein